MPQKPIFFFSSCFLHVLLLRLVRGMVYTIIINVLSDPFYWRVTDHYISAIAVDVTIEPPCTAHIGHNISSAICFD